MCAGTGGEKRSWPPVGLAQELHEDTQPPGACWPAVRPALVLPGGSDAGRSLLGVPDGTNWVPSRAKGLRFAFGF